MNLGISRPLANPIEVLPGWTGVAGQGSGYAQSHDFAP